MSNTAAGLSSKSLLMVCRVLVEAPDGSSMEARVILVSASSASFVSEHLSQSLRLTRSQQVVQISGIAGLSHKSPLQAVASLSISAVRSPSKKFKVTAVVVPCVMCDLPLLLVPFYLEWRHLEGIPLADPYFGLPGRIDILLGVDIFVEVLRQGWRTGAPGSPSAFETKFGWVLSGKLNIYAPSPLSLIMFPSSLEMICYKSSGRLKNIQKSDLLCNTSKTTNHEQRWSFHFSSAQETACKTIGRI